MDEPLYEMIWRNKFLTTNAKTIDDMIKGLSDAAASLQTMKEAGVTLDEDSGIEDDYALLITNDPVVALQFGMTILDIADDEDDLKEH